MYGLFAHKWLDPGPAVTITCSHFGVEPQALNYQLAGRYNVIGDYPRPGSGGEYDVQDGFGWTNGAILDLLVTYNHRLHN
ncbi:hypothetical protein NECAME_15585 [Necator americanus]|uniref:Trehalase n=1 Tax=Necator americanus TaxID=51031 RepID=W2SJ40_NECAM|nr:hypothetical protein NECAME_15585 [Necator americanus]ETN68881.1 hypothetical protein NECAME_15585 [Necator americanus]